MKRRGFLGRLAALGGVAIAAKAVPVEAKAAPAIVTMTDSTYALTREDRDFHPFTELSIDVPTSGPLAFTGTTTCADWRVNFGNAGAGDRITFLNTRWRVTDISWSPPLGQMTVKAIQVTGL